MKNTRDASLNIRAIIGSSLISLFPTLKSNLRFCKLVGLIPIKQNIS